MNRSVVIVSGVRTAVGDFGGALADFAPCDLASIIAREAVVRAGCSGNDIDLAVFGHVIHTAPEDMYLARVAALRAGVSEMAPALTLNRLCGSGLQAVLTAAEAIMLGNADIVLAGGSESMSRAGHLLTQVRTGQKMGAVTAIDMMTGALTDPFGNGHMGVTAENVATKCGIGRATQDAFALESHRRAAHAQTEGRFRDQIHPLTVKNGRKEMVFDTDEHVRPGLTAEDLAKLRPAFDKTGSVTAGNSSGLNDGAGALVLMEHGVAIARGARLFARIVAYGMGGVAPGLMGLGPVPAVRQALARAGLKVSDLDVIESNEAFSAQACAVANELEFDASKTNPNGGAVSLGHPIGASGAIILIKLIYELKRCGGRYGLATMCIGGGQGIALVVENLR